MSDVAGGLGAVDIAMLAVLAISVLIGLWRGLTFEVLALAGWVVAYFAASWYAAAAAGWLPAGMTDEVVRHGVAFAGLFLGVLIAWTLLARLVRLLVHATPLSFIDRVGGGAFGVLRGALLLLVLATVVRYTPAAQSLLWQTSLGARWLSAIVDQIEPLLPGEVGPWLPAMDGMQRF